MAKEEHPDYLLGKSLRQARTDVRLNQTQLGVRAGWEEKTAKSKVSKIESGGQIPTPTDLEQWAAVTGVAVALLDQWKTLAADEHTKRTNDYKNRLKGGQAPIQEEWTRRAQDATSFRFFEMFGVPRYLQVPEYSRAILEKFKTFSSVDDLEEAVQARRAGNGLVYDPDKTFRMIIDEPVLLKTVFPRSVMRPQLLFLQSFIGEEDQLRIYPSMSRKVSQLTLSSFNLFDNIGFIETEDGGADPLLYNSVVRLDAKFQLLWDESVGGDDAREIIAKAISVLPAA